MKTKDIKAIGAVILSSVIYSFAMNSFVSAGNLFPGGFSGISRLLSMCCTQFLNLPIPFGVFYFGMNILVTGLVFRYIGKRFACLSILWFTLTSVLTSIIPKMTVTQDMLLIAVFGGIVCGFALSIALCNDASSGGTDFISIYFSLKFNMPVWNYILGFNACILVLAGFLFGWDKALYSIIYQFCSTQVVNTMHKRFKISCVEAITENPEEVSQAVFRTCRHGITKFACEGEYSHKQKYMLQMNINTYQLKEVIAAIQAADPKAFITITNVERVIGNYYQKPLD